MIQSNNQMQQISPKAFFLPLIVGIVVVLLNAQWLNLYQLMNAPQADSLVYLTEAYNDYWSIRNWEWGHLFNKYVVAGNQQTSPLLWGIAAIFFLLFGLEPSVAYWVIAFAYLVWVCGVVYLAWNVYEDIQYAIACGLLAALLPSVVSYGLRHFMLDFVAAAPFIWATAFLIKSDLMHRRRDALLYAVMVGVTILFRSTAVVYFLSHIGIIVFQAILRKRHPHYGNIALAALVTTITCGWFIIPNVGRILSYYGYWAAQAKLANPVTSFSDNLLFYFGGVKSFHMLDRGFAVYASLSLVPILILFGMFIFQKEKRVEIYKMLERVTIVLILVGVPTICLSLYSSRAPSVDYLFIAGYLLVPFLLWRTIFPKSRLFLIPALMLLFALGGTQLKVLISSEPVNDYRERDVINMILADAETRGLHSINLGSTPIHQHNCLSYQYWTLANYFPRWTNRVNLVPIGRTSSAEELAKMNKSADYVITLENYHADWHPNNVVAPEANKILQESYGMRPLSGRFDLPDGTTVKILARQLYVTFPPAAADGWHENRVPLNIRNPDKMPVSIRVTGELINPTASGKKAVIFLSSKVDSAKSLSFETEASHLDHIFNIPANFFEDNGVAEFELNSSWAGSPSGISSSKDTRNLAFRHLAIESEID
jgi:hypothetical protein